MGTTVLWFLLTCFCDCRRLSSFSISSKKRWESGKDVDFYVQVYRQCRLLFSSLFYSHILRRGFWNIVTYCRFFEVCSARTPRRETKGSRGSGVPNVILYCIGLSCFVMEFLERPSPSHVSPSKRVQPARLGWEWEALLIHTPLLYYLWIQN